MNTFSFHFLLFSSIFLLFGAFGNTLWVESDETSDISSCIRNTTFVDRLPSTINPLDYFIQLELPSPQQTALNHTTFSGHVQIRVEVLKETSCIILSSNLLVFGKQNVSITFEKSTKQYKVVDVSFMEKEMLAIIQFDQALPLQEGTLSIHYFGQINVNGGSGLFLSENSFDPSDYNQESLIHQVKSKTKRMSTPIQFSQNKLYMFATQFEEKDARRCFPCWDEPAFKATFRYEIKVLEGDGLTILANTPQEKGIINDDGSILATFERTKVRMSSYLVAFAVGKFDYVEKNDPITGVRFRIYTPPGASEFGKFALNVSVSIVQHFESIFGLRYFELNSKMDQISVPALLDNAMENQGLLTYYPPFLLVDSERGTLTQKELVSLVTVHEISHQWYGDTVTCPYWTSEYLQEGFARYLQYSGTQYLFPQWNVFTRRAPTKSFGNISFFGWPYSSGMRADYQGLSPPVVVLQQNGTQSSTMLYEKGASVNRMIEVYLGKNKFDEGLSYHVTHHKFTNPDVYDLMQSFETVVGKNIDQKWLPWLLQPGFPVVKISVDHHEKALVISQTSISKYLPSDQTWWIPLHIKAENHKQESHEVFVEVTKKESLVSFPYVEGDWIIQANYNYSAFVCVTYDQSLWKRLIRAQVSSQVSDLDFQLFSNCLIYLTQMSHEKIDVLLDYSDVLGHFLGTNEKDVQSAEIIAPDFFNLLFQDITSAFLTDTKYNEIRNRLQLSLRPILKRIGWINGSDDEKNLRDSVTFWAVFYQDEEAISTAQKIFASSPNAVPDDIQRAVFFVAASTSSSLKELLKQAPLSNEMTKNNIYFAISTAPSHLLCEEYILFISNNFTVLEKLQYLTNMIAYSSSCREEAWKHYQKIAELAWHENGDKITNQVLAPLYLISLKDVESFLKQHKEFISSKQMENTRIQVQITTDLLETNFVRQKFTFDLLTK